MVKKSYNNKFQDYLPRIQADIKRRIPMIVSFFLLAILFKAVFKESFPSLIILIVFVILFYVFLMSFIFNKFKKTSPGLIIDLYFLSICLDVVFLTIIIYLLGGITWIGPFFYSLVIINVFWLMPVNKAIFLILLSFFFLSSLVGLQYLETLDARYLFLPAEANMQNFYYVVITVSGSLAVLFFLSYSSDLYRRVLDKQITRLKAAEERLKQLKENLEIEIHKKTEDLENEKKNLEQEVKKRTKELEERRRIVRARVEELEKFHRLAVERELEMSELKEKIANLRTKKRNA